MILLSSFKVVGWSIGWNVVPPHRRILHSPCSDHLLRCARPKRSMAIHRTLWREVFILRRMMLLLCSVVLTGCASESASPSEAGAFASKRYRNLFVEAGHAPPAVTTKLSAAFQQLFHGRSSCRRFIFPLALNANGPLAFYLRCRQPDVRSEGMSHGMMIAAQLNRKAEFDALWNWSKTFMQQPTQMQ